MTRPPPLGLRPRLLVATIAPQVLPGHWRITCPAWPRLTWRTAVSRSASSGCGKARHTPQSRAPSVRARSTSSTARRSAAPGARPASWCRPVCQKRATRLAQPFGRHLVRQQAHGFATGAGPDHLAHPASVVGTACMPGRLRASPSPWPTRLGARAVQHGDWACWALQRVATALGRHLKAPQVRVRKPAAPGSPGLLHAGLALNANRHGRAQPQPGQLGHHAPGVATAARTCANE